MSLHKRHVPSVFDGLTRQSMRLLLRIYVFEGAPHGLTVAGLFRYWRERSASWRSLSPEPTQVSVEQVLRQRFLSEGLCAVDGSLPQALQHEPTH